MQDNAITCNGFDPRVRVDLCDTNFSRVCVCGFTHTKWTELCMWRIVSFFFSWFVVSSLCVSMFHRH